MATRYFRKKVVLAKIESTYATDPTPTGGANAMLVTNCQIDPLEAEYANRDTMHQYMGHDEALPVAGRVRISFDVEVAGAGGAGTAPKYGPLLRACGMSETISAGVDVQYKPVSTGFESVTLYYNLDGKQHKALGCRGSVSLKLTPKQIPYYNFTFTGLYVLPTDTALPTPTLSSFQTPLPASNANDSGFALHSFSSKLYDFGFDLANQVVYRNLIGVEDITVTDRAPTGSIVIEDPTMAEKDFFTIAKNATLGAFTVLHGTAAGNKVQLDAPAVQLLTPKYENRDGVVALAMGMRFKPSSGDDEFVIKVF